MSLDKTDHRQKHF